MIGKQRNNLVIAIDKSNYEAEVALSDKPVAVQFGAPWCSNCRAMKRHFEAVSESAKGAFKFGYIDVEENEGLKTKFDIQSVPALIILKNGGLVRQKNGLLGRSGIESFLKG